MHATNHHKQTPLHIGASGGQSAILSILLENGTDPDALDDNLNNGEMFVFGTVIPLIHTRSRKH